MNSLSSGKLNDWLQILGLFGVVAGLAFVGMQLQQDRQFTRVQLVADGTNEMKYWTELLADNADVWAKGLHSEPLSISEKLTFDQLEATYDMQMFSIWFRFVELGVAPPESVVLDAAVVYHRFPGLLAARNEREARDLEIREQAFGTRDQVNDWASRVGERIEWLQENTTRR
jgi:hypothetical protein